MKLSTLETKLFDSVEFCLALVGALPMPVFLVDEDNVCTTLSSLRNSSIEKMPFMVKNKNITSWKIDIKNEDCVFAQAVKKARETEGKISLKGKWTSHNNYKVTDMIIAVHAVSASLNGEINVIAIVEDLTQWEQLKGLLPICMTCNKIYNEKSHHWDKLEEFISENSSANFSHGLCPECSKNMINTLHDNGWGKNTHERKK